MTTTYLHHDTEVRIIEELGDGCVVVESVNGGKPFMNQGSKVPYWLHCDWAIAKVADLVEIVDDEIAELDLLTEDDIDFGIFLDGIDQDANHLKTNGVY